MYDVDLAGLKNFHVTSIMTPGEGGTQYKRPYGDVPQTWVAKSASWYMNDLL